MNASLSEEANVYQFEAVNRGLQVVNDIVERIKGLTPMRVVQVKRVMDEMS